MKSSKGGAFERQFCKDLSRWWTGGERDDVFWRTSNSGGRATTRGKKGTATHGQYGDICATDPVGAPLLQLITFELKRGYNKFTVADLFDKPEGAKQQLYEKWFAKAERDRKAAWSWDWVLVVKRDRRDPLLFVSDELLSFLAESDLTLEASVRLTNIESVSIVRLSEWFEKVNPEHVKGVLKKLGRGSR